MKLSKEIIKYIQHYGYEPEDLSEEVLKEVIEEYNAKQNGAEFLDGVLCKKRPRYRR